MIFVFDLILLVLGLGLLIKGADVFLESASKIAKHFGVSDLVISLTLVSFATSLPEFGVTVMAALTGASPISLSNIVGSGIANICLVVGIPAIFVGSRIHEKIIERDILAMIISYLLLMIAMLLGGLSKTFGLVFLFGYLVYLSYLYQYNKEESTKKETQNSIWKHLLLLLVSIVAVYFGSKLTVGSAVEIARILGISEWVIGATILAVGTSLPELAVVAHAIIKKKVIMGIGTAIGSNIFNILFILGATSLIRPLMIPFSEIWVDLSLLLGTAVLLELLALRGKLGRKSGALLILTYVGYLAYLLT